MHRASESFKPGLTLIVPRFGLYLATVPIFWAVLTLDRRPLGRAIESWSYWTRFAVAIGVPAIVMLLAEVVPALIGWICRSRSTTTMSGERVRLHLDASSSLGLVFARRLVRGSIGPIAMLVVAGAIVGAERRETGARHAQEAREDALKTWVRQWGGSSYRCSPEGHSVRISAEKQAGGALNDALAGIHPEFAGLIEQIRIDGPISEDAIRQLALLPKLADLYVHDDASQSLPAGLGTLTRLTSLGVTGEQLERLPPDIGRLTSLRRLLVSSAPRLSELPPEIGELADLKQLVVDDTRVEALPPEFARLQSLRILTVSRGRLKMLPPEIGSLSALGSLELQHNAITALPPEIGRLSKLGSLDLTGNALSALPSEIGGLRIVILTLRHNRFTEWPREIEKLTTLTSLHLEENRLRAIPPEIAVLVNLAGLYLEGNPVTALPPEIGKLVRLERLNLKDTELKALPREIGELTSLQELELYGARLTVLPREIGQLGSLKFLQLGGNRLAALPPELGRLSGLRELRLLADPAHPGPDPYLKSPPWEVVEKGTIAVLDYLHKQELASTR